MEGQDEQVFVQANMALKEKKEGLENDTTTSIDAKPQAEMTELWDTTFSCSCLPWRR